MYYFGYIEGKADIMYALQDSRDIVLDLNWKNENIKPFGCPYERRLRIIIAQMNDYSAILVVTIMYVCILLIIEDIV